jgi:hypothetical protein
VQTNFIRSSGRLAQALGVTGSHVKFHLFKLLLISCVACSKLAGAVDFVTVSDHQARFRFHGVLACEESCVGDKAGSLRVIRADSDGTVVTTTVIYEAPVPIGQYVELKKDYHWGSEHNSKDPSINTRFSFLIAVGDCESTPQNIEGMVDIDIGSIVMPCKAHSKP